MAKSKSPTKEGDPDEPGKETNLDSFEKFYSRFRNRMLSDTGSRPNLYREFNLPKFQHNCRVTTDIFDITMKHGENALADINHEEHHPKYYRIRSCMDTAHDLHQRFIYTLTNYGSNPDKPVSPEKHPDQTTLV